MTAVIAAIFQVEGASTSPLGESCVSLRFLESSCVTTLLNSHCQYNMYLLQKATDYLIKNYSLFSWW